MRAEQSCRLRQLGLCTPDPCSARPPGLGLDQRAIAFQLLRRHVVIGDLGIAAKRWRVGHRANSFFRVDCEHILLSRSTYVDDPLPDRWPSPIAYELRAADVMLPISV